MLLLRTEFSLSHLWQELIVSATVLAACLAALAAGHLADTWGRRPAVLVASALFAVGSLCIGRRSSVTVEHYICMWLTLMLKMDMKYQKFDRLVEVCHLTRRCLGRGVPAGGAAGGGGGGGAGQPHRAALHQRVQQQGPGEPRHRCTVKLST